MKKTILILLIFALLLGCGIVSDTCSEETFNQIDIGMSYNEVVKIIGEKPELVKVKSKTDDKSKLEILIKTYKYKDVYLIFGQSVIKERLIPESLPGQKGLKLTPLYKVEKDVFLLSEKYRK